MLADGDDDALGVGGGKILEKSWKNPREENFSFFFQKVKIFKNFKVFKNLIVFPKFL